MAKEANGSSSGSKMGVELAKFALFAAVTLVAAWLASTGRVAYMFTMLVVAAALAYAVLDCSGYEIVKKRTRR